MIIKKLIPLLLGAAFAASAAGCTENSGSTLTIKVLDIGKADAIIVKDSSGAMLIDCGNEGDGEKILSELSAMGIEKLDVLQITHYDKDHVGGAAEVLDGIAVEKIIAPDYTGSGKGYYTFAEKTKDRDSTLLKGKETSYSFGGTEFTVYPCKDPEQYDSSADEYDNMMSLVTVMEFDGLKFLFCGDAEKDRIDELISGDTDWSCSWMKVPHHGNYGKKVGNFIVQASPQYAVITDSEEIPAEDETTECLEDIGAAVFRTSTSSVLTTASNGKITVSYCDDSSSGD